MAGSAGHRQRPIARENRLTTSVEAVAVLVVIAAVIAMAVWFFFFAHGGMLPGAL